MRFKESITIQAPASAIFAHYQDVNRWHVWDKDIISASLQGAFIKGSIGWLKPKHGPKSKFILTEVTANKSFTSITTLPFCRITFRHVLEEKQNYTTATHEVIFTGLFKRIFGKLVGKNIQKGLPNALIGLKSVCEDQDMGIKT
jgi:hypothetical protein